MKKSTRSLSTFLAALMMSSAFAVSASAAIDKDFIVVKNTSEKVVDEAIVSVAETKTETVKKTGNDTAKLKTSGWVKTDSGILRDSGKSLTIGGVGNNQVKQPSSGVVKVSKNPETLTVYGGKYYSKLDADKEIQKYFDSHTYDLYMYMGDERTFCDGAYYVSTDSDVVYYDYMEGRLVAKDSGSASVYVYTKGGVPFFRLDVNVINKLGSKYSVLDLIPDKWQLDGAGDTTGFTIETDKDYKAEDFYFTIAHGEEIASITRSGKLSVDGNGPIVVRVALKSNPNICGEALLYSGKYVSSFYDGYYTCTGDKYVTSYWGCDYDISDSLDCSVKGWIKSQEGILIPVLKKNDVTVDGEETTLITFDKVSIADLLYGAYGDKADLYEIITKYNLFKDKDYLKDVVTYRDFDYLAFLLSQMID